MTSKAQSRKWQLTVFLALTATVGLFLGKLTGGEWAGVASVLTAAYNWANVKAYEHGGD